MNNVPRPKPCMPCMNFGELKRRMNREIHNWFDTLINTYRSNHMRCLCVYKDAEILAYQLHLYAREKLCGMSIMLFYDEYKRCIQKWLLESHIVLVYQEYFLSQEHFVRSWSVRATITSPEL